MAIKVAFALTKQGTLYPMHFAHAEAFRVYRYEGGRFQFLEERENPLAIVPDLDEPGEHHAIHREREVPVHGIEKYRFLRERVLRDVDVVIASSACATSFSYFVSEGVKVLFTDPVDHDLVIEYLSNNHEEFEEMLERYYEELESSNRGQ